MLRAHARPGESAEYATSRTRTCQKPYSASPSMEDWRDGRTSSLRASSWSAVRCRRRVAIAHRTNRAGPEHLPDDGGVLEEGLAVDGQRVEPGGDERLNGVGEWRYRRRCASPAALVEELSVAEHPDELLRVQRVAAGPLEQELLRLGGKHGLLEQAQRPGGRSRCRRAARGGSRFGCASPAAPRGVPLVELRPGGADDEQRDPLRPVGEVLEEVEKRLVGPVDVLDDEHERPFLGDALEEAPPGRERLLSRRWLRPTRPRASGSEPRPQP